MFDQLAYIGSPCRFPRIRRWFIYASLVPTVLATVLSFYMNLAFFCLMRFAYSVAFKLHQSSNIVFVSRNDPVKNTHPNPLKEAPVLRLTTTDQRILQDHEQ